MAKPKMKTKSEGYVETRPGVRGGAPVIAGTGIKVLDVAVLELSQIHAALSYDREWKASLKKVARLRAGQASILGQKLGSIKNLHG